MSSVRATIAPLRSISGHLRDHRALFIRVVAVSFLLMVTAIIATVLSVHAATVLLTARGDTTPLLLLTAAVVAVGTLAWTDSWISHVLAYRVIDTIRLAVHGSLARLAPLGLGRRRSGETAATAMSDAEQLEWFFAHTIAQVFAGALAAAAAAVAAVVWLGLPGLVIPLGQALLLSVPLAAAGIAGRHGTALRRRVSDLSASSVEMRQSARDLVLLGLLDTRREDLRRLTVRVQRTRRSIAARIGAEQAAIEVISATVLLTMVIITGRRVSDGALAATQLPIAVVLAGAAMGPVLAVVGSLQKVAEMSAAAERIDELLAAGRNAERSSQSATPPRSTDLGGLDVTALHLTYPGSEREVLSGVELHLSAGEHVALVGASGAGKTTLVHALVRLFDPASGGIHVGGVDVRAESPDEARDRINLVGQHPHIFRTSIRDNLLIARPGSSDEHVWKALQDVGLADHVRSLDAGLDTVLAERGATWSGGQRQRLGLARGVLRDPDVLILDEPTANLDQHAEQAFMQRALALRRDRTTLVVSHRVSTIEHCPRVLFLVDGHVVADGSHADLLSDDPQYRAVLSTAPQVQPSTQEGR